MVIDLGLQSRSGAADRDAPGTPASLSRVRWRTAVAGCCLLLVPPLATTAAPERATVLAGASFDGEGERFAVVADQLLIAEADTAWAVYDLPDGRHRWGLPAGFADLAPEPAGSGLLVSDQGEVRDAATGELHWSGPRPQVMRGVGIGLVETDHRAPVDTTVDQGGRDRRMPRRAAAVELVSGDVLWSVRAAAGLLADLVGDPADPGVVVRYPDGAVEIRDLTNGRVLARDRLLTPDAAFGVRVVGLVDGVLLLDGLAGEPVLHGYAVPSLRRLWTRPYALDLRAEPCADVLCLRRDVIGRAPYTEVIDPATGRMMWSTEAGRVASVGGLLLLQDGGSGYLGAVVAADTGRRVRELSGWGVAPSNPPDDRHVTLVGLGSGGFGTVVARLDVVTLAVTIIGSLPYRVTNCHGFTGGMVCYDAARRIGIWRFRQLTGDASGR